MKTRPFPLCCGAVILTDFGHTDESMGDNRATSLTSLKSDIERALTNHKGDAFICAILNEQQVKALHSLFSELGFVTGAKGFTSGYGYILTMYIKINDPNAPHNPNGFDYTEGQQEYDPDTAEEDFDEDDGDWEEVESCNCELCVEYRERSVEREGG